jgi:hypothetical protein
MKPNTVKLNLLTIAIGLIIALIAVVANAQTNAPAPGLMDTNPPSQFAILGAAATYTNVIAIPYIKYDLNTKKFGYGAAALYRVSDYFYTGLRIDRIDGYQSTAGVQAQLQANVKVFGWINTHPFLETSVGIGSSSLYGSAGPGIAIDLLSKDFHASAGHTVHFFLDPIADFEHVVQNGAGSKNSNQLNAGLMLGLNF